MYHGNLRPPLCLLVKNCTFGSLFRFTIITIYYFTIDLQQQYLFCSRSTVTGIHYSRSSFRCIGHGTVFFSAFVVEGLVTLWFCSICSMWDLVLYWYHSEVIAECRNYVYANFAFACLLVYDPIKTRSYTSVGYLAWTVYMY